MEIATSYAHYICPKPYALISSSSRFSSRYLQNRSRVSVWLYENVNTRIEGHIIGFDEYMNLVMDGAEEVSFSAVV